MNSYHDNSYITQNFDVNTPTVYMMRITCIFPAVVLTSTLRAKVTNRNMYCELCPRVNTSAFLPQICDLGSARSLEHTTRQTTAIGTYAWMAPEVGGPTY